MLKFWLQPAVDFNLFLAEHYNCIPHLVSGYSARVYHYNLWTEWCEIEQPCCAPLRQFWGLSASKSSLSRQFNWPGYCKLEFSFRISRSNCYKHSLQGKRMTKSVFLIYLKPIQIWLQEVTYTFSFNIFNPSFVQVMQAGINNINLRLSLEFNISFISSTILKLSDSNLNSFLIVGFLTRSPKYWLRCFWNQKTPQISISAAKSDTEVIESTRLTCPLETTQAKHTYWFWSPDC